MTNEDAAKTFGDALVSEIWAEMGRRGIRSVRALADVMQMKNHSSLNDRLNRSSKTGERVAIGGEDLYRIATALGLEPGELVVRADRASRQPTRPNETHTTERKSG